MSAGRNLERRYTKMKIIEATKTETEKIRPYYGTVILAKPTALKGNATNEINHQENCRKAGKSIQT
jgi:hypothetical protein